MKAAEVLKLLRISRETLCRYVKNNKIAVKKLPNGYYDYNASCVYKLLGLKEPRQNVVYCRVSTTKQKADLENQQKSIKEFCAANGIQVDKTYLDISSGLTFDRKEFQKLVQDVVDNKINKIYITYPDRLSRISFNLFKELFSKFNVEIVAICKENDPKTVEQEVFQEIISLLHCFAMKVYSKRRRDRLTLLKKQLELEETND